MGTAAAANTSVITKVRSSSTDQTVSRYALSSSLVSNLFATIVRSNTRAETPFNTPTTVGAIASNPQAAGTSSRARMIDRTNRNVSLISADDAFKLKPARTFLASVGL